MQSTHFKKTKVVRQGGAATFPRGCSICYQFWPKKNRFLTLIKKGLPNNHNLAEAPIFYGVKWGVSLSRLLFACLFICLVVCWFGCLVGWLFGWLATSPRVCCG